MTTIPYIHFTDEQKQRAASVDLPEFLRRQGEKLLPSGREYRLGSDHSITVRGSSWYDHAAGRGGYLADIDQQAEGMFLRLVEQMAEREGATEKLKAEARTRWVGLMNNIADRAMEIVNTELVYV